jgi:hypothetical protein
MLKPAAARAGNINNSIFVIKHRDSYPDTGFVNRISL